MRLSKLAWFYGIRLDFILIYVEVYSICSLMKKNFQLIFVINIRGFQEYWKWTVDFTFNINFSPLIYAVSCIPEFPCMLLTCKMFPLDADVSKGWDWRNVEFVIEWWLLWEWRGESWCCCCRGCCSCCWA